MPGAVIGSSEIAASAIAGALGAPSDADRGALHFARLQRVALRGFPRKAAGFSLVLCASTSERSDRYHR
jgi:hypothetical protein